MIRHSERGNAFFIVMVAVVLFGALMFTFSRGMRQGGANLTEKQAEIAASDTIAYAQTIERAVNRVLLRGYSETQLSFDNSFLSGYENANCTEDRCRIFHPSGGAVKWQSPPPGLNDGSNWIINGKNAIPDVGVHTTPDLVLMLTGLSGQTCLTINDTLGVPNPSGAPPEDGDSINKDLFTGTFAAGTQIGSSADLSEVRAACVWHKQPNPDDYIFYVTLWQR